ncbi:hypothetical protein [Actinomadura roseirufa]|uniref:hypothetical protein n=1 Tax=Actinomadura roseirufa TaxID=2094049 RepID=UPI001041046F|nr:hypothetical protein [Actinomadura roseirufa]
MADSPPRSDAPGPASGDDLTPRAGGGGAEPGRFTAAPAPWGGSPPWWSTSPGDGTGPHGLPGGTGPHALPGTRGGTGPLRVPRQGGGTGPHRLPPNGTGPQVMPPGTGSFPAVPPNAPGAVTPPAEGRRQVSGLLLGAGIGAVLVAVLTASLVAFQPDDEGKGKTPPGAGPSTKKITAVAVAGGLHRDATIAPQASAAYPFVAAAVRVGGVPAAKDGTAVYAEPRPGRLNVLFMGGTGAVGNPAAFLQRIRPSTFITGQNTAAGKDGRALCGTFAVLAAVHAYCGWATKDSYGIVASNVPGAERQLLVLAELTRRIRRDVEKPKR